MKLVFYLIIFLVGFSFPSCGNLEPIERINVDNNRALGNNSGGDDNGDDNNGDNGDDDDNGDNGDTGGGGDTGGDQSKSYQEIRPIIANSCLGSGCHSQPVPARGVALETEEELRIYFIQSMNTIESGFMPRGREKLSEKEVADLNSWYFSLSDQ